MTSPVARLQKIVHDLMELNSELEKDLATLAVERNSPLLKEYALLAAFKGVVDHTRHLTWPYLLSAEQHAEDNVLHAMQRYRMERIRQMLDAMQRDHEALGSKPVELFFNELQRKASAAQRPN
jgi:tRNA A37 methylthiotransferase MiaB